MRITRTLGPVLVVLTLAAAACLPGGQSSQQAAGGDGATAGSEAATEAGSESFEGQTLTVWDIYPRGAESEVVEQLNSEFEAEHGVTIEREARPLDDLKVQLPLALQEDDGPDVASVNQGQADMGTLVESGLLLDLSQFAEERGWAEAFGENLLERNRFTEDGSEFGTGNLYGVAPIAEVVGWYYNKAQLDQAGVEVPETFEELQAALAQLEEADLTPIAFGNSEGWPAIHTYGAVQHTYTDTGALDDFIFRRAGASFADDGSVEAAATVQDWAEQGYFTENFSGIGYDASWGQFAAGEGATMLTGSWISGELDQQDYGFFLTPGRDGELPPQIGGQGVPLAVRAGTDVPELAKAYIDWMTGERAAELWIEQGILPARVPESGAVEEGTLLADIVGAWDTVLEQNQLGHYLDWASPTMYDTLTSQLQALLAGRAEPQEFVEAIEADYTSAQ